MDTECIEQLKALPKRADEVWQGGWARVCDWGVDDQGKPFRPRACFWYAVKADLFGPPDVCGPDDATVQRAAANLPRFAEDPATGGYLPGRIEVRDSALAAYLEQSLSELNIDVVCKDQLPMLDEIPQAAARRRNNGPLPPGALTGKGVTLDHMRCFAEAARAFHATAMWEQLTDEDLIHIEQPKAPARMRCTTVLGASGHTFGLAFFDKPEDHWALHSAEGPSEWFTRRGDTMWSMSYDDITGLPFGDADLWEDHDLPVDGEDAYPCFYGYSSASGIKRPDAKRLEFLVKLLDALARTTETDLDAGRWTVDVETADGPEKLTLSIPDLLAPPDPQTLIKRGRRPDRRAMEQMYAQMDRFLEDQQLEDMDAVNAAIAREFAGKPLDPGRFPPRNPLEQAQDLCYQAFGSFGRRQLQLAREAIGVCPDCADAYVILAERSCDLQQATDLYAQGVAAGERALGPDRFRDDAGQFWGQTDTRPYMRARFGLAQCLQQLERLDEAAEHYREILRLNASDNQGVRYLYLPLLLELDRDAEAARFLKDHGQEISAMWAYVRALLAYRRGGDTPAARTELRKAIKVNRHVIDYLAPDEDPAALPDGYAPGSREEAINCAAELRSALEKTPGGQEWLYTQGKSLLGSATKRKASAGRNDRNDRRKRRAKERKRKRR